jgi:3-methyladenine DNA glycosylase Tag
MFASVRLCYRGVRAEKIIRNRAKLNATVSNAQCVLHLDRTYPGGFVKFVWDLASHDDRERLVDPKMEVRVSVVEESLMN